MIDFSVDSFPTASDILVEFGLKFSDGGTHISRTIMLEELEKTLSYVPSGSCPETYREAIVSSNILGKTTLSTRQKTYRHLRELYALNEDVPIFFALRRLFSIDNSSLPLLAIQIAWSRDPLLRATTQPIFDTPFNEPVTPFQLAEALLNRFPNRYSELNANKISRNAASSWAQSGHLAGHKTKVRNQVTPTFVSVALAMYLGSVSGYNGRSLFSNPWARLLDLNSESSLSLASQAHGAGLLNLRHIGEVVEISFPQLVNSGESI